MQHVVGRLAERLPGKGDWGGQWETGAERRRHRRNPCAGPLALRALCARAAWDQGQAQDRRGRWPEWRHWSQRPHSGCWSGRLWPASSSSSRVGCARNTTILRDQDGATVAHGHTHARAHAADTIQGAVGCRGPAVPGATAVAVTRMKLPPPLEPTATHVVLLGQLIPDSHQCSGGSARSRKYHRCWWRRWCCHTWCWDQR